MVKLKINLKFLAAFSILRKNIKKMAKGKKKIKVSKKDRAEYATIEAKVEELELKAVAAQTALDDANAAQKRPSQSAVLELAGQVSTARKEADDIMERYLHLDEMISQADA